MSKVKDVVKLLDIIKKSKARLWCLILITSALIYSHPCDGQLANVNTKYPQAQKIKQIVKLGIFGCNYKIHHKVGPNQLIQESEIRIPKKGILQLKYKYNPQGYKTYEEIIFKNKMIIIDYEYEYASTSKDQKENSYGHIVKQITSITAPSKNYFDTIKIDPKSNSLTMDQVRTLKKERDQAILNMLGDIPKTEAFELAECNCRNANQSELIDEIYSYQLSSMNLGISIGPGRRNGVLTYIGKIKDEKWMMYKSIFTYNQKNHLVDRYKYWE